MSSLEDRIVSLGETQVGGEIAQLLVEFIKEVRAELARINLALIGADECMNVMDKSIENLWERMSPADKKAAKNNA